MTNKRERHLPTGMVLAAVLSMAAVLTSPAVGVAASFRGLGGLNGAATTYSIPRDVSGDGSVVVGESQSFDGVEAFRWTSDVGMVGLGDLGGTSPYSSAFAVSADGGVVVGVSRSPSSGSQIEAFRWELGTGMVGLGDLPGGEYLSGALGVSGDGSVVAGSSASSLSPNYGEAFQWTQAAGLVGLGVLPGAPDPATITWGMSDDASVVVGWAFSANGREAFRWSAPEGMVGMGDLPAGSFDSWATSVSADGSAIVGLALNPGPTAFYWTAEKGMTDLGRPQGGNSSAAWAISATGSVVVGDAGVSGERVPAIWNEMDGMRNLIDVFFERGLGSEIEGWDLEQATGVSADGLTVVGWGFNPEGNEEAWVAYLGEPSLVEIPALTSATLVLFSFAVAAAGIVALRRR